jgi:hypothetical protein
MLNINKEYYQLILKESPFIYNKLREFDEKDFNEWVNRNFNELGTFNSFEEIIPCKRTFNRFKKQGYNHIPGQCHYSAKAINLLDPKYLFFTGFVIRNEYEFPLMTHSFNLFNKKKIVDFSKIANDYKISKNISRTFPDTYYGVCIPNWFVKKYREDTFNGDNYTRMNPLLIDWYIHLKNKTNINANKLES